MLNKVLICGSGPSLPSQLKGVDLSDFKVVRINAWKEIDGVSNKCDAWAFYPFHSLGESESLYDFEPYLKVKELWMPHFEQEQKTFEIVGRYPDYCITKQQTIDFHNEIGHMNPTTGAVVIYMAILKGFDVYIAGFDSYEKGCHYYDIKEDVTNTLNHHLPSMEKFWINDKLKKGIIKQLERSN